jgi:hypothetical protein
VLRVGELRKVTKNLIHDTRFPDRDLILEPPENDAGVLTIQWLRSMSSDGEGDLQAANKSELNKKTETADKGWSFSLGSGQWNSNLSKGN